MEWSEFFYGFLQAFLMAVAPILATVVTGAVVVWAKAKWAEFKRDNEVGAWQIEGYAKLAVKAAEQAGIAGFITDKKSYAVGVVQQWLDQKNIKLDFAVIEAAIEAAVFEELTRHKQSKS